MITIDGAQVVYLGDHGSVTFNFSLDQGKQREVSVKFQGEVEASLLASFIRDVLEQAFELNLRGMVIVLSDIDMDHLNIAVKQITERWLKSLDDHLSRIACSLKGIPVW